MKLTAVFEHWHLGDGNHPAFAVGDEVRLSFELTIHSLDPLPPTQLRRLRRSKTPNT